MIAICSFPVMAVLNLLNLSLNLDRGPGSFDVEDATTLSWSSAAVSEWVSQLSEVYWHDFMDDSELRTAHEWLSRLKSASHSCLSVCVNCVTNTFTTHVNGAHKTSTFMQKRQHTVLPVSVSHTTKLCCYCKTQWMCGIFNCCKVEEFVKLKGAKYNMSQREEYMSDRLLWLSVGQRADKLTAEHSRTRFFTGRRRTVKFAV